MKLNLFDTQNISVNVEWNVLDSADNNSISLQYDDTKLKLVNNTVGYYIDTTFVLSQSQSLNKYSQSVCSSIACDG